MVKLTVRLPEELYQQLTEAAKKDDRSINGQVIRYIRYGLDWNLVCKYMKQHGWTPPASLEAKPEQRPRDQPKPEKPPKLNIIKSQARAGGNLAHVVAVYDDGEARAVDNFLKKLRASK